MMATWSWIGKQKPTLTMWLVTYPSYLDNTLPWSKGNVSRGIALKSNSAMMVLP